MRLSLTVGLHGSYLICFVWVFFIVRASWHRLLSMSTHFKSLIIFKVDFSRYTCINTRFYLFVKWYSNSVTFLVLSFVIICVDCPTVCLTHTQICLSINCTVEKYPLQFTYSVKTDVCLFWGTQSPSSRNIS